MSEQSDYVWTCRDCKTYETDTEVEIDFHNDNLCGSARWHRALWRNIPSLLLVLAYIYFIWIR